VHHRLRRRAVDRFEGDGLTTAGGSQSVRDAIKAQQPLVGLHGHIHESGGRFRIGRTQTFNPGSEYSSDVLRGVIVDFDAAGDYLDFLFTSG